MKIYRITQYNRHQYQFLTNCISSSAEKINSMTYHPSKEKISYDNFVRYVGEDQLKSIFPSYDWNHEGGLTLEDDYAVGFYESVYQNMPCCYIDHSSIEWIFVEQKKYQRYQNIKDI